MANTFLDAMRRGKLSKYGLLKNRPGIQNLPLTEKGL
jgi:hypothetical protein